MLVFVYGTLLSGYGNNALLYTSTFVGRAETQDKMSMGARGIPYVTNKRQETKITGEVYDVTNEVLGRLDRLEGHPDFYERKRIRAKMEDGKEIECWMYMYDFDPNRVTPVPSGDYRKYTHEVRHSLI